MTLLNSLVDRATKVSLKVPLRAILVVPFVLQIFAVVGLTGWLSLRNGQQAVYKVTSELRNEVIDHLEQRLKDYIKVPHLLNQVNAEAIKLDELYRQDPSTLTRHYWRQRYLFDSGKVSSIYFGSIRGEFIGLALQDNGTWQISRAGKSTGGKYYRYDRDSQGNPTTLLEIAQNYDPRLRPWYKHAVSGGKSTWSEIYPDFKEPRLTISLGQPIYDRANVLRGVVGVDLVLSEIGEFLKQTKIGKSGQSFIIERSGQLVATSTLQKPFTIYNGTVQRIRVTDANNPLIRATAQYLIQRFGDFNQIKTSQLLDFTMDGQRQLLQVVPFSGGQNLNWLIVVVVPERDFMEQINANTQMTILLCLAALAIATLVGMLTSRWITQPILQLSNAATALSRGEWNQPVADNRADEVGVLARAFNQMALQLQQSFTLLERANAELENRVEERTAELTLANQQLHGEILERQRFDRTLRSIFEGTASSTGDGFFRSLVCNLAAALQVRYALISEFVDPLHTRVRTLAFWTGTSFGENFEYNLTGTPCEQVIHGRASQFHPEQLQALFPDDRDLVRMGAHSYLGVPLIDMSGNVLGHLAVMDDKPMEDGPRNKSILEIFAARAATERERQQSEEALRISEALNRSLLRAVPDLMMRVSWEGIFLDFFPSKYVESVVPDDRVVGKSVFEILPPEVAQQRLHYVRQALLTEKTQFHEYQVSIRGEVRHEESRIVACGEDDALIIVRDITDRKQAEAALRQSEAKYRELAQQEELINTLAGHIRNSLDLDMILETAVREIRDLLKIDRCHLMWYRADAKQPYWEIVKEARHPDLPSCIGRYLVQDSTSFPDGQLEQFLSREVFRVDDFRAVGDPLLEQSLLSLGYTSLVGLPIQTRSGELGVITCAHTSGERPWSDSEIELLQAVTDQLAIAISQAELYDRALKAQEQSDRLLLNILPEAIAERLKHNQQTIADSFEEVTVLFADIVGFTQLSARVSPNVLVERLNEIFSTFDRLAQRHGLEKIKTIGDAYMVVGGLPAPRPDHAEAIAAMALDMQREIQRFKQDDCEPLRIRIGINSGPVIAGVIGLRKFIYDLWGDTVNTASRMESHGIPGCIQVTATTYERLRETFILEERGVLEVKGKGKMATYFLKGKR